MSEEAKKNKKNSGIGIYIFTLIIAVLISAITITQYRILYIKTDVRNSIKTVNTTQLIQQYKIWAFDQATSKNNPVTEEYTKKFLADMTKTVTEIQEEYEIAVFLEQGAVIGSGFYDFTDELRKRLVAKGYSFLAEANHEMY